MSILKNVGLIALAIIVPVAVSHGVSVASDRATNLILVGFLEIVAFGFLMATARPHPIIAVLGAIVYFPMVFALIFQLGVLAGYNDYP